jgi:hypothetical protein
VPFSTGSCELQSESRYPSRVVGFVFFDPYR